MLVECLSIGRCITLPSGATGTARYALGWSGGFTRVRRQFNVPVADGRRARAPGTYGVIGLHFGSHGVPNR